MSTPLGPVDATSTPRYGGETTFSRLPRLTDAPDADVLIWGVPFDSGVSYRPGARFGPNHIRQSSRLLRPYNPALKVAPFTRLQVADAGDIGVNPFDLTEAITTVQNAAATLSGTNCTLITAGGDHTITLPLLRVQHQRHGPVAVLHFDAHLDTWDTYFGAPYTHGTPFRRAAEEGLIDFKHSMHVGIRGPLYSGLDLDESERLGFAAVHCRDFLRHPLDDITARIRDRLGARPVYVSVDIDVLDPAFAPGTGTPEAGGLSSMQLLELLRGLDGLNIVGADVVEVAPAYDHAEITGIAAAHVIYELLSVLPIGVPR
ncbi:agmatinase [Mycobacteroides abscessus]|uniref:agmatinase n=1 Tax=Mycobacteroides abscessus TaxID=36809 RepID=UPI0009A822CC|nr:agmatinase [Mycobacteroides abscessus]SKG10578.1 putative agmatinase [Mycobacteroides abscessus subsp. massiliense]SKG95451.1 putative agmatinase [Mycobacteroides abscessus subsp. massiliense]SKH76960.1 putative agmatinase [Mycobacteroides abscessus subsp. massiliense]SKI58461.1 putative agmatinase [Mycobacteroides abscessus subsp. massiliense]SKI71284.1 putative agmatinase [Mycobacteroides abscessus subsp. massiliense]